MAKIGKAQTSRRALDRMRARGIKAELIGADTVLVYSPANGDIGTIYKPETYGFRAFLNLALADTEARIAAHAEKKLQALTQS